MPLVAMLVLLELLAPVSAAACHKMPNCVGILDCYIGPAFFSKITLAIVICAIVAVIKKRKSVNKRWLFISLLTVLFLLLLAIAYPMLFFMC
jgi:hypothetical protein